MRWIHVKTAAIKKNSMELPISFFLSLSFSLSLSLSLSLSFSRLAEILNLSIARIPREHVDRSGKRGTQVHVQRARLTYAIRMNVPNAPLLLVSAGNAILR